jgi:uncharacterized metal-binding protein
MVMRDYADAHRVSKMLPTDKATDAHLITKIVSHRNFIYSVACSVCGNATNNHIVFTIEPKYWNTTISVCVCEKCLESMLEKAKE